MKKDRENINPEGRLKNIISAVFFVAVAVGLAVMFFVGIKDQGGPEVSVTPSITSHVSPISDFDAEYGSEPQEQNGFAVTERRYKHNRGSFTVLDVENRTDKACTLTVSARFLDENGTELGTERCTFKGMAQGYSHRFVFAPEYEYAKFEYELTSRFFEGTAYAAFVELADEHEVKLVEENGKAAVALGLPVLTNNCERKLDVTLCVMAIDEKGELIANGEHILMGVDPGESRTESVLLMVTDTIWEEKDTCLIPTELAGLTLVCHVVSAERAK